MKILYTLLFILTSNFSFSQLQITPNAIPHQFSTKVKTNIEDFVNSIGRKIKKEITIVYQQNDGYAISNFDFLKIIATDIVSNKKMNGIYISCYINQNAKSPQLYSYIDEDEIKGVVDFLNLIIEESKTNENSAAVEYLYTTKNIKISMANSNRSWENKGIKLRNWKFIFELNEFPNSEFPYYSIEKIVQLKDALIELKFN